MSNSSSITALLLCCSLVSVVFHGCRSIASTFAAPGLNTYQTGSTLGQSHTATTFAGGISTGMQTVAQNFTVVSDYRYCIEGVTNVELGVLDAWDVGISTSWSLTSANSINADFDGSIAVKLFTKIQITDSSTYPFAASFLFGGTVIDGSQRTSVDRNDIKSAMRFFDIGLPISFFASPYVVLTVHPHIMLGGYSIWGTKAGGYSQSPPSIFQPPDIPLQNPQKMYLINSPLTITQIHTKLPRQYVERLDITAAMVIPSIALGLHYTPISAGAIVSIRPECTIGYLYNTWFTTFGVGIVSNGFW